MNEETPQTAVATTRKAPMIIGPSGIQLTTLEELWRFAGFVAESRLAPKGLEKPESIVIALQMGMEVGLPPMASLQNIAVINGRPTMWGDAQLAVVRATGELERFEEAETDNASDILFREFCLTNEPTARDAQYLKLAKAQGAIVRTKDDFGVSVFVKRRGATGQFGRFTIGDAKTAQLWGKAGPWSQYPARMLKYRARSFTLRDGFGDALRGLLSTEEAQDTTDDRFKAAKPVRATVSGFDAIPETVVRREPEPATQTAAAASGPAVEQQVDFMAQEGEATGKVKEFIAWMDVQKPPITFNQILALDDLTRNAPWLSSVPAVRDLKQEQAGFLITHQDWIVTALKGGSK